LALTKLTKVDIILAGCLLAAGLALAAGSRHGGEAGEVVVIRGGDGAISAYSIRADTTLEIQGRIGVTAVAIVNGRVRFVSSPCPHKLCIQKGWISKSGEWLACVPNGVWAKIEGGVAYDGVTP
jgi:hypothetical protein